ncbi:MAG: site-specific integrase [Leucobacter sp.]
MTTERYPDNQMEYAQEIPARWIEFADRREELLLNYGYNTARAYWADLQDWFEWAVKRDKDVLVLNEKDRKQYVALLRRRKYSENTIRRRLVALRLLMGRCRPSEAMNADATQTGEVQ